MEKITEMRDSEAARIEVDKLHSPITHREILKEWSKIKDGAPGLDNLRITHIKYASTTHQQAVCNVILDMAYKHTNE